MSETVTYQGKIVEVVEFASSDGEKTFEKARRAPGIRLIIPIGTDEILLTHEHRQEVGGYDFRLPGGKVFDTLGEYNDFLRSGTDVLIPAIAKAEEEARQEAGITVQTLSHFHTSTLGATMEWDLYYFVAENHVEGSQELEDGEEIEVVKVSRDEAHDMCLDGRVSEERSALVLLRYLSSGA